MFLGKYGNFMQKWIFCWKVYILLTKLAYGQAEYGPPNPQAEEEAANAPPYDGICAAADGVVSVGAVAVVEDAANIVLFV